MKAVVPRRLGCQLRKHSCSEPTRSPNDRLMSTIGPKQTSPSALHMSAYGGKADMAFRGNPLSRSLFGGKADDLLHCICLLMTQAEITEPFQSPSSSRYDGLIKIWGIMNGASSLLLWAVQRRGRSARGRKNRAAFIASQS